MQHKIFYKLTSVFCLCIILFGISFAQDHWDVINNSTMRGTSIQFVTPQTGWVGSIYPPYSLYKSRDGGFTWTEVLPTTSLDVTSIAFYNEQRGFITSTDEAAVTYDGENWEVFNMLAGMFIDEAVYLDSLCLIGTATIMIGDDWQRRQILRSNDGGRIWSCSIRKILK